MSRLTNISKLLDAYQIVQNAGEKPYLTNVVVLRLFDRKDDIDAGVIGVRALATDLIKWAKRLAVFKVQIQRVAGQRPDAIASHRSASRLGNRSKYAALKTRDEMTLVATRFALMKQSLEKAEAAAKENDSTLTDVHLKDAAFWTGEARMVVMRIKDKVLVYIEDM